MVGLCHGNGCKGEFTAHKGVGLVFFLECRSAMLLSRIERFTARPVGRRLLRPKSKRKLEGGMMMIDMLTYLWIDRINAEKLESKAWVPTTKRESKPEMGYACCGTRLHKFRLMVQDLVITYRDACRETQSRFNAPSQKSIRAVIVNSIPHRLHYD